MVKLVAMHGAVAATEVLYYAGKKLGENVIHYEHRQQAPWGYGFIRPEWPSAVVVDVVIVVENNQKTESGERTRHLKVRLCFRLLCVRR